MRLDKFLKITRILKRRTVAKDTADSGRITVNSRPAKPAHTLKPNDIIGIRFGNKHEYFKVLSIDEKLCRKTGEPMFKILEHDEQPME